MRLDEINRRGFLGAVAGAAASTVVPAKEINAVLNSFTKSLGGTKNIEILNKLLSVVDINMLDAISQVYSGDYSLDGALDDSEMEDLQDAVWDNVDPSYDESDEEDPEHTEYHRTKDYLLYGDNLNNELDQSIDALTELIGDTGIKKVRDMLVANKIDPAEFFDKNKGFGQVIKDASDEAFRKKYPARDTTTSITPDNIVDVAKAAALPIKAIRIAGIIASLITKIYGKSVDKTVPPEQNIPQNTEPPAELPAPSDSNGIDGLGDLTRMKDLAGIKRNEN